MSGESLRAIEGLTLPELRAAWHSRWGEPPKFRSRDLMARAFAYQLQAGRGEDLLAVRRRQLNELADRFQADRRYTPIPAQTLKPGSALIREWSGLRHEVAVTETGFEYAGETFRSLSKIAERITGTHWNGQVFFGLKARKGAAA